MSKYKNIHFSIIYYVLNDNLDVSSISTHTYLSVSVIYCCITRLYCLQPIVLGTIFLIPSQGRSHCNESSLKPQLKILCIIEIWYKCIGPWPCFLKEFNTIMRINWLQNAMFASVEPFKICKTWTFKGSGYFINLKHVLNRLSQLFALKIYIMMSKTS